MTSQRILLALHLVGVSFWLGGQLFLLLVALPALRGRDPEERREILRSIGMSYGMASIPALLLILATGAAMMSSLGLDPASSTALRDKLGAVAVVLVATVVHSIASTRRRPRLARAASITALAATLAAVWLATGL